VTSTSLRLRRAAMVAAIFGAPASARIMPLGSPLKRFKRGGQAVQLTNTLKREATQNLEAFKQANEEGTHGKLTVLLMSGSGLRSADSNGLSDPYVIVKPAGSSAKRCRTVYKSLNPVWNDAVTFEGALEAFLLKDLKLRVFDRDFTSFNDPLGNCQVSIKGLDQVSSSDQYPMLKFDEIELTGGIGYQKATGHISFRVMFELTPQRFAFPAAPVHASAAQALAKRAPPDATSFELRRDRIVKFMATQRCFMHLAIIWGVLFLGWVVFFALLIMVRTFGWPKGSYTPDGEPGSAPFTIANMDTPTLMIWLNNCNHIITGLFSYQKALAVPWRFAILHSGFFTFRDNSDGLDFYGRPTEAVWFHIPLKWRKRIALLLFGDFFLHYICQLCHIIWYTYEMSENPPGNIPTMIAFLSSICCGIAGGVIQGGQEKELHKKDPARFPPNPMKFVGDALHKFRKGEIKSIKKLIEEAKEGVANVTNFAEVNRASGGDTSNKVMPFNGGALEEDVENGGTLPVGVGAPSSSLKPPKDGAGEDAPAVSELE